MDGENGQKRKGTGRRGPYKRFHLEETCSSDTLQGNEDMTMSVSDATEADIDATTVDTQIQCSSQTVESELSAEVRCNLSRCV
jgi:hypothetical protein